MEKSTFKKSDCVRLKNSNQKMIITVLLHDSAFCKPVDGKPEALFQLSDLILTHTPSSIPRLVTK